MPITINDCKGGLLPILELEVQDSHRGTVSFDFVLRCNCRRHTLGCRTSAKAANLGDLVAEWNEANGGEDANNNQ